jgi:hypothetical protein
MNAVTDLLGRVQTHADCTGRETPHGRRDPNVLFLPSQRRSISGPFTDLGLTAHNQRTEPRHAMR